MSGLTVQDEFYIKHGPCCAGCDWWRFFNSSVGECTKSAPVSGPERIAMLGMDGCSLAPESGHILTRREHMCGDFKDTLDWPERVRRKLAPKETPHG